MSAIVSEQQMLLNAIVANPEDDAPRLAYADWLQENPNLIDCAACAGCGGYKDVLGKWVSCEPCRETGSFDANEAQSWIIRHQLEVPDADNICCGIDGAYSEVHSRWASDISDVFGQRDLHQKVIFRRGFVDEVRLSFTHFLAHARTWAKTHPVRLWNITDRSPMCDSPYLGSKHGFIFSDTWALDYVLPVSLMRFWSTLVEDTTAKGQLPMAVFDSRDEAIVALNRCLYRYARHDLMR